MTQPAGKITAVLGHPLADSFCAALLEAYLTGARNAGAEVRTHILSEKAFDPILHRAYRVIQELEPDLKIIQEDIRWADHLVFAFPIWWGVPPALMKGFLDRILVPGFAYKYATPHSLLQDKLLKGRSGRILCTMDSPTWYYRLFIGSPGLRMMKNSVLKFCGISPVHISAFGSVKLSSESRRQAWLKKAEQTGATCR